MTLMSADEIRKRIRRERHDQLAEAAYSFRQLAAENVRLYDGEDPKLLALKERARYPAWLPSIPTAQAIYAHMSCPGCEWQHNPF